MSIVMGNIFGYLRGSQGAANLAQFSLVAGSIWNGRGRGVEEGGVERMIHRELLSTLAPLLPREVDQVILPENSDVLLRNMMTFLYCGR